MKATVKKKPEPENYAAQEAAREKKRERYHSQEDLLPEKACKTPIGIVGAGAIGSFAVLSMAKMGMEDIRVVDFDSIEDHNIANQLYPQSMVGEKKVKALRAMTKDYTGTTIKVADSRWDGEALGTPIVIAAVDDMDVRTAMWKRHKKSAKLYIDARMGAEVLRVYTIDPSNAKQVEFYESTLYPQEQAAPEKCTAKSIIYTVLLSSGIIASHVKKYLTEQKYPKEILLDARNSVYLRSKE